MQQDEAPLGHAQATHDGAGIKMALHVAPCRQRYGDGRKHHGQQGRQAEKTLRPVQRTTNLRSGILGIFEPLTAGEQRFSPTPEPGNRPLVAGNQQAITDSRTRLHQPTGCNVVKMHHQARREAEKIEPAIRLHGQNGAHRQFFLANRNLAPRQRLQCPGQTFIQPYLTGFWASLRRLSSFAGAQGNGELPA